MDVYGQIINDYVLALCGMAIVLFLGLVLWVLLKTGVIKGGRN